MKTNLICVLLLSFFLVKMDAFAQKAVICLLYTSDAADE